LRSFGLLVDLREVVSKELYLRHKHFDCELWLNFSFLVLLFAILVLLGCLCIIILKLYRAVQKKAKSPRRYDTFIFWPYRWWIRFIL